MVGASILQALWVLLAASRELGLALLTQPPVTGGGAQHGQPADGAVSHAIPVPQ